MLILTGIPFLMVRLKLSTTFPQPGLEPFRPGNLPRQLIPCKQIVFDFSQDLSNPLKIRNLCGN